MVVQNGIKLAVNLISTHFGDLVTKVCECLLRKGTLTLQETIGYTELSSQQVKNCLLVLIQHNCVHAFTYNNQDGQEGNVPKGTTQYTAVFENIIHRMRFPKFLAIVSEELDKECEELFQGLLQHGRLTVEQIILRAISKRNEGGCAVQDAIRATFEKLVNAHYVERCYETVGISQADDKNSSTGKRGAKLAKFVEIETAEQRAMSAGVPSDRFLFVPNTGIDATSEANASGKSFDVTVGEKRKVEALEMDERKKAMLCEKEVLWRANFEKFAFHLRQKACVATVRSQLDDGAAVTLNAMIDSIKTGGEKVPLSSIYENVIKNGEGRNMTEAHVRAALDQIGCHCSRIGTEESYSLDLKNIVEIAQNDEVESLVSKRYGRAAYSLFRLLSKTGKLMGTDKIADTLIMENMEALKILYSLWKDDYVHMEKLVSHGSAQSQYLLWRVNKRTVREHVFDETCHAALNLRLKLAYELEQEREIIQLPKDKRIGAQGKRFERSRQVNILLESSLMKLDEALMLFNDFCNT